ncbi:MAG: HAD-IIA family hydrolase [Lachnospirales bacterium]
MNKNKSILQSKKTFLLDLDGTVYNGNSPIPTANEFIEKLYNNNLNYFFISNNAHEPSEKIQEKLNKMGIIASKENIVTCIDATLDYLENYHLKDKIHVLGNDFLKNLLLEKGYILDDENPNIVLVGFDKEVTFEKLSLATKHLLNDAILICTGVDGSIPSDDGIVPYTGALCEALAVASKVTPIYMGKPEKHIFNSISNKVNCSLDECIMIGDRLDTDIEFGISNGVDTCLVLTGTTNRTHLKNNDIAPTIICDDLSELTILLSK